MRVRQFLLSLGAVPLLLGAAPPPPPVPLEPASKWGIDYGAQRCTLYRKFGAGRSSAVLRFEQTAPLGLISILLTGDKVRVANGSRDNILEFLPIGGVGIDNGQSAVTTEGSKQAVYWGSAMSRGKWGLLSNEEALRLAQALPAGKYAGRTIPGYKPPPIKWEDRDWSVDDAAEIARYDAEFNARAARVEMVALNPSGRRPFIVRTGSLEGPLKALEKCTVDSLKAWGIDAAVERTVAVRARPVKDTSKILSAADYPIAALIAGKESRVEVWLNIDATGRPVSCRIISSFATPEINDRMCKLVQQRQTFIAAKTAQGVAVPSYIVQSFHFRLAD